MVEENLRKVIKKNRQNVQHMMTKSSFYFTITKKMFVYTRHFHRVLILPLFSRNHTFFNIFWPFSCFISIYLFILQQQSSLNGALHNNRTKQYIIKTDINSRSNCVKYKTVPIKNKKTVVSRSGQEY